MIRILGEDGSVKIAQIEPAMSIPYKEERDERGQAIRQLFNPTLWQIRYFRSGWTGVLHQSGQRAAGFLSNVTQSNPQMMQIVGDLMFKAMDVPYADEIAERLRKLLPPNWKEEQAIRRNRLECCKANYRRPGDHHQLAQELQASGPDTGGAIASRGAHHQGL